MTLTEAPDRFTHAFANQANSWALAEAEAAAIKLRMELYAHNTIDRKGLEVASA